MTAIRDSHSKLFDHANLYAAFLHYVNLKPNSTALIYDNGSQISYSELHNEVLCLANILAQNGVTENDIIPVFLPRSKELVKSILAILQNGASYTLIDLNWPEKRIENVIEQLSPPLILGEKAVNCRLDLKLISPNLKGKPSLHQNSGVSDFKSPACVFFTSGTTGEPKGVVSTHAATLRLFQYPSFANFNSNTIISLASATPWDAFSLELWGALANGGTALIIEDQYLSAATMRKGIKDFGLNTVWMTSSLFNMNVDEDIKSFSGLNTLIIGGERISKEHAGLFLDVHPSIELINGYGPVESCVFATTHKITKDDCNAASEIPIGLSVPETQVYILDDNMNICPEKKVGQICISGLGLAKEYLNEPKLTKDKFKKPRLNGKPIRIYCTGDLGYIKDDVLHFLGRRDRQVKVRGHRVEPAEVETQINKIFDNRLSCKILPKLNIKSHSQELIAFCVSSIKAIDENALLKIIKNKIPSYQCPSKVFFVKSFPLTSQGKLDEKKLLKLAMSDEKRKSELNKLDLKTNSSTETFIIETVAEFFDKNTLSRDTPFTELGVNSLDLGRISARLSKKFDQQIPLSILYKHPTISTLSHFIDHDLTYENKFSAKSGNIYMNHTQLMYLTQHLVNPYNISSRCLMSWLIKGKLNLNILEQSIIETHNRHPALCSYYLPDDENKVCYSSPSSAPSLSYLEDSLNRKIALESVREELSKDLDPTQGKLWRAAISYIQAENQYIFACAIHHIAFDGYSEHLFTKSISESYNNLQMERSDCVSYLKDKLFSLIPPPVSQENKDAIRIAENLKTTPEILWPKISNEKIDNAHKNNEASHIIPGKELEKITSSQKYKSATKFEILLYSWAVSLSETTGQDDFSIGIPVRTSSEWERSEEVGCNVNMIAPRFTSYELRNDEIGFKNTRQLILLALKSQDVPFTQILQVTGNQSSRRTPVFQTLFALQDNPFPKLNFNNLRTEFLRQPYLDLPLELHAEIWPLENGDLKMIVSYKSHVVSFTTVQNLLDLFSNNLERTLCYL